MMMDKYETYLFKVREFLKHSTKSPDALLNKDKEFFSVGLLGDLGIEEHVYFSDFTIARDYYLFLERGYKALYEWHPDGTRKRMEKYDIIRKPFDYAAPIKDINKVPCMKLNVSGSEAFAHFNDAVYCYKYDGHRKFWKLLEIKKAV